MTTKGFRFSSVLRLECATAQFHAYFPSHDRTCQALRAASFRALNVPSPPQASRLVAFSSPEDEAVFPRFSRFSVVDGTLYPDAKSTDADRRAILWNGRADGKVLW